MNEYSTLSKENLIDMTIEKDRIIKKLKDEVENLSLLLAMGKARTFSKKSESIDQEEVNLFNYNEVESLATTTLEAEVKEINHRTPRKAKAKNHSKIDLEKFVTKTVTHSPIKDDEDASDYDRISQDTIYKANVNVKIEVTKHIYETVKRKDTNQLLTDQRDFPFNNSIATPSLVSYVANEKYVMGAPLYRQEAAFLHVGFPLSRVDLSNYLMKGAAMLYPFYLYLKHLLIHNRGKVIHADETTLKVIHVGDKKKKDKCYMWLYATGKHDPSIYIYEYRYDRSGKGPKAFLRDYSGYLTCDDYSGYHHIPNVTLQKCWVHARRKFFDIYKANKDPKIKGIIELIDALFDDERVFREQKLKPDEIKSKRNKPAHLAKLNGYFEHLESLNYSPKSVTGKAINYSLKNKRDLMRYLESGYIPIDNNLAERGIKPFVINRKNFLFSNTEKGAEASSIYMSVIQTAKTNGLDPKKYLEHLFEHMYRIKMNEKDLKDSKALEAKFESMEKFLPWDSEIQKRFKVKEATR
jgi:transposase